MIRRACERDIPDIGQLLLQVHAVHAQGRPDLFIPGKRKYTDDDLRTLLTDETRPVFVFENEDGRVVGHAFCELQHTLPTANQPALHTLYIDDICVDADFRRQRIAARLYEYVKAFAAEAGCTRITLNVWTCNPAAQRFYESMGMLPMKTTMEALL